MCREREKKYFFVCNKPHFFDEIKKIRISTRRNAVSLSASSSIVFWSVLKNWWLLFK